MKAIELQEIHRDLATAIQNLKIVDKPLPKPKHGQVLIKIEAAPCNPSDLIFLQGMYGVKKKLPTVPGWEGAGTVVESGGGLHGWWLKGKRVACGGQSEGDGTWAEYYVTDAKACIPLKDQVPSEQGATLIINPLTAVGMVEKASKEGHAAIIQTAACGQVGRMVQTLAKKRQIPLINVVRRQEQVDELLSAGEKWVFNSEEEHFVEKLSQKAKELKATIAFEAIAGVMTGRILQAMPAGAKVLVYGALSEKPCADISPLSLIFENKKVEGFWLSVWIQKGGFVQTFKATNLIQSLMGTHEFETKIRDRVGFEEWKEALLKYHEKMTLGKMILTPN